MNEEIANRVIDLAAEQVGVSPADIVPATNFINDLEYDSLDVVEFQMALEDEFELSVPDEDLQKLPTVGDVITYIEHQLTAGSKKPVSS